MESIVCEGKREEEKNRKNRSLANKEEKQMKKIYNWKGKKFLSMILAVAVTTVTTPLGGVTIHGQKSQTEVTKENDVKIERKQVTKEDLEKSLGYSVFTNDAILRGWKNTVNGNMYVANSLDANVSEFYINGNMDIAGTAAINGWKREIKQYRDGFEKLPMPELNAMIEGKLEELEPAQYKQEDLRNKLILNGVINVDGNFTFSGNEITGEGMIIATGDITLQLNKLKSTGNILLYSKNGNINIQGNEVQMDGILYAPKGAIYFGINNVDLNGRMISNSLLLNQTILNVTGKDTDFEFITPKKKEVNKVFEGEDFKEGKFHDVIINDLEQLMLTEDKDIDVTDYVKTYNKEDLSCGVKVEEKSDKSFLTKGEDAAKFSYDLTGYGIPKDNGADMVILADESWSMTTERLSKTKEAAKKLIEQMRENDRCGIIGFSWYIHSICNLTSDKEALVKYADSIRNADGTDIYNGLKNAMQMITKENTDRQKIIFLISDGEDSTNTKEIALEAKKAGIKIYCLMIGESSIQMQNIAAINQGIYKNAPTPNDIEKIMTQLGSEVLNTAGRNAVFKTTLLDPKSVDMDKWEKKPDVVTENPDGTLTVEWRIPRISIDELKQIEMVFNVDTTHLDGFVDLTADTSFVYYDKDGKPVVLYLDDITLPVHKYVGEGSWETVLDSELEEANWKQISWEGTRFSDGSINVSAAVSSDGEEFSKPKEIKNYEELEGLVGRYLKLIVTLKQSYDGKSPVLDKLHVVSEGAELELYKNAQPKVQIITRGTVKENRPLLMHADVQDDCQNSEFQMEWFCDEEDVVFSNPKSNTTTVKVAKEGTYEIQFRISDGERVVESSRTVVVEKEDSYLDIDSETNLGPAPSISCVLPEKVLRGQVLEAQIDSLNDTEIAWYSVIYNNNTTTNVSEDGKFELTIPYSTGTYTLVIQAFDWSGQVDKKEYKLVVTANQPTISVKASASKVEQDEEAYFKINVTDNSLVKKISYWLNDEAVSVKDNDKYILDTSKPGTYELKAELVSTTGKVTTVRDKIEVVYIDRVAPSLNVEFDKEFYYEDEEMTITVDAQDNVGVTKLECICDDKNVEIVDNQIHISKLDLGEHKIVIKAWDAQGNVATAQCLVNIQKRPDTTAPVIKVNGIEKLDNVLVKDKVELSFEATDESGTVEVQAFVNGEEVEIADGKVVFVAENVGEYKVQLVATDEAGNQAIQTITFMVMDDICPVVDIVFNTKDYNETKSFGFTVNATDNDHVETLEATINGEIIEISNGVEYVVENATEETYEIEVKAFDRQGNMGSVKAYVKIEGQKADVMETLPPVTQVPTPTVKPTSVPTTSPAPTVTPTTMPTTSPAPTVTPTATPVTTGMLTTKQFGELIDCMDEVMVTLKNAGLSEENMKKILEAVTGNSAFSAISLEDTVSEDSEISLTADEPDLDTIRKQRLIQIYDVALRYFKTGYYEGPKANADDFGKYLTYLYISYYIDGDGNSKNDGDFPYIICQSDILAYQKLLRVGNYNKIGTALADLGAMVYTCSGYANNMINAQNMTEFLENFKSSWSKAQAGMDFSAAESMLEETWDVVTQYFVEHHASAESEEEFQEEIYDYALNQLKALDGLNDISENALNKVAFSMSYTMVSALAGTLTMAGFLWVAGPLLVWEYTTIFEEAAVVSMRYTFSMRRAERTYIYFEQEGIF